MLRKDLTFSEYIDKKKTLKKHEIGKKNKNNVVRPFIRQFTKSDLIVC